jgi:hypothetical protein
MNLQVHPSRPEILTHDFRRFYTVSTIHTQIDSTNRFSLALAQFRSVSSPRWTNSTTAREADQLSGSGASKNGKGAKHTGRDSKTQNCRRILSNQVRAMKSNLSRAHKRSPTRRKNLDADVRRGDAVEDAGNG